MTGLQAQTSLNATGSNASGSGGSVSYSVGQVVYTTNTGTSGSVAEGVQQTYQISTVSAIETAGEITLSVSAYPNPTTDYLTLSIDGDVQAQFIASQFIASLYDINGKLLQQTKITSKQTRIEMVNLISGTYFVRVNQNQSEVHHVKSNHAAAKQLNVVKTFKIIKQ
jgi:hypothetical protein